MKLLTLKGLLKQFYLFIFYKGIMKNVNLPMRLPGVEGAHWQA